MAPNFDLTQIQSTLNQAMSQLGSVNGGAGASVSGNNNYVNSVWGLVQEGQTAANGNDQQKAQAITNIVQNLMGMLMSLGTNENSKATKEVKQNEKNVNDLDKKADEASQNTQSKINEILASIADNTTSISKAMDAIKKLGGDNGQIAKAQEKLNEQLKVIETNQEILNDSDSSPDAKKAALEALVGAATAINDLLASIVEVQKQIEVQNGIVETSSNNVAGLIEESAAQISNGIQTLQGYVQEGGVQTVVNTTSSVTGTANETVGAEATAMGSAANSNIFTGASIGQKLIRIGSDQTAAGATRIQGSVKNLSALTKSIGEMGSDLNKIASFTNLIGEAGNSFTALVGQYGAQLEPVITATGSWTAVAEANAQFEEAIVEYQSKSGLTVETPWSEGSKSSESSSSEGTTPWAAYANKTSGAEQTQQTDEIKFEFDTNIFRDAFEKQGA